MNDIYNLLQQDILKFLQLSPQVALSGDFNSRTGGLSDIAQVTVGKDTGPILDMNTTYTQLSISHQNPNWYIKTRQTKDTTHNNYGKELIQMCKTS